MSWTVKAVLLAAAVVCFLLALVADGGSNDLFLIGMMCFAGAFLAEAIGMGGRRLG